MVLCVICFPLVDQPRLDKSAEEPFSHHGGLRLQGRQQFREFIYGQVFFGTTYRSLIWIARSADPIQMPTPVAALIQLSGLALMYW